MSDFYPTLIFTDQESSPAFPEFYEDYPILVSDDPYEAGLKDVYNNIYKIWEEGEGTSIRIVPKNSKHILKADIDHIDVYVINTYVDGGPRVKEFERVKKFATLTGSDYSFDEATGNLILDNSIIEDFKNKINDEIENNDDYAYCIGLDIFFEKYRSIEDTQDLTPEEMTSIATMQSVQAAILEYYYQFQIATESQQKLNEIAYTVVLTVMTTLPLSVMNPSMVITETLEELFLDPLIEATVAGITGKIGNWLGYEDTRYAEIIASTVAETGRETIGGAGQIISQMYHKSKISKTLGMDKNFQKDANSQQKELAQQEKSGDTINDPDIMKAYIASRAFENLNKKQQKEAAKIKDRGELIEKLKEYTEKNFEKAKSDPKISKKKYMNKLIEFSTMLGFYGQLGRIIDISKGQKQKRAITFKMFMKLESSLSSLSSLGALGHTSNFMNKFDKIDNRKDPTGFTIEDGTGAYIPNGVDPENSRLITFHSLGPGKQIYIPNGASISQIKSIIAKIYGLESYEFDLRVDSTTISGDNNIDSYLKDDADEIIIIPRTTANKPGWISDTRPIQGFHYTITERLEIRKNLIYKVYRDICREIIETYSKFDGNPSDQIVNSFGEGLELKLFDMFPLKVDSVSSFLGFRKKSLEKKFNRIALAQGNPKNIKFLFKQISPKIKVVLTKAFGSVVADNIISKYLLKRGGRTTLMYEIYDVFYKYTGTPFDISVLSRLIFPRARVNILGRMPTRHSNKKRDVQTMFKLEYSINRMKKNTALGFTPTKKVLDKIKMECTQIIRKYMFGNGDINSRLPKSAFNMLWSSFYALSDAQGGIPVSIETVSRAVSVKHNVRTIDKQFFNFGKPPYGQIGRNLKLYLTRQGVHPNDIAIQWIDEYLKERGSKTIDIDIYDKILSKKLSGPSGRASETTLSENDILSMELLTWTMSCGRSWMTGEEISRDEVLAHHISHDKRTGKTLYGGFYETMRNFAAVKGPYENKIAEGHRKWQIEAELIEAWVRLLNGEAPSHWPSNYRRDFLKDRKSKVYITDYARKLPKLI